MKCALVPLTGLIVLGSGCADVRPSLPAPPLVLALPDCPAPERPSLPHIDGALSFDAPVNVAALLERDDLFRLHTAALEEAIACFRGRAILP